MSGDHENNSPAPAAMRKEYGRGELLESGVLADPILQFGVWFEEARAAGIAEPNAMTVATADGAGRPSARILLLKGFDAEGFVFFTNYLSRKGKELEENPRASLVFFWEILERQVRVEGAVSRVSRRESEEYFHSRPLASQIGAWVSTQSGEVGSREELEAREKEIAGKYAGGVVPLPEYWGGYRLAPDAMEFWQGRVSRLHDRLVYNRMGGGAWQLRRLWP